MKQNPIHEWRNDGYVRVDFHFNHEIPLSSPLQIVKFHKFWEIYQRKIYKMSLPYLPAFLLCFQNSFNPYIDDCTNQIADSLNCHLYLGLIILSPPIKGLNGFGIITLPSSCWKFSNKHTIMRGTAHAVAFRVWTNCVGPKLPLAFFRPTCKPFNAGR